MRNACINAYMVEMWINMILDMDETPHLVVDVSKTNRQLDVPVPYIVENRITLNVAPRSITNFHVDKELGIISFGARFNAMHRDIYIPCEAIVHVYSRDSGTGSDMPPGLMFYEEPQNVLVRPEGSEVGMRTESPDCAGHSKPVKKDRSFLKVVK